MPYWFCGCGQSLLPHCQVSGYWLFLSGWLSSSQESPKLWSENNMASHEKKIPYEMPYYHIVAKQMVRKSFKSYVIAEKAWMYLRTNFHFVNSVSFWGLEHYSIWKVVQYYCRNSSSMWSGEYCRLSQMIMMMVFRVVLKNAILSSNPWSLEMDCVCASSLSIHKSAWKKKKKEKKKIVKKNPGHD